MIHKIYINPGHSDKDPGAVGYETERLLALRVSSYMIDYLQRHFKCEIIANSGDSLYALCDEANAWGAALYVAIHFNAGKGDGFECYVYSEKTVPLGRIFAEHVASIGQNLRSSSVTPGVKIRTNLAVLYRTTMPAILLEGAFVDNLKDIQDWNDDAELKAMGIAYAKAAAEYLGLEEKAQAPVTAPEQNDGLNLRVLKKGDKGDDVRALQILLAGNGCKGNMFEAGYGSFGDNTVGAVRLYQKKVGLPQTGVAEETLWRHILGL